MEKISPFAQKVLSFIEPDESRQQQFLTPPALARPSSAPAMQAFVARIRKAADDHEKVLIAGDYDCDGMMSTTIMKQTLDHLGIENGYYIPDRIKEGYGLNPATVRLAKDKGYSLIVTVDNGVQALPALSLAAQLGIDVIVTDHHQISDPVPAQVLVHPDVLEPEFSTLCGAGIAYECARALEADDESMLVYAAVASVSDCMEVVKETRSIIQLGLKQFNARPEKHLAPFVRSLPISETDVSFQIAPRINSIGRLADRANANSFIRYMLASSPTAISRYASELDALNNTRKELSAKTVIQAETLIKPYRRVLLAMDPSFHEGVIGLAAGNLCSRYNKPVIVCTKTAEGYKGSMRAPEGFSCLPFLSRFDGFSALGGHDRAAGFTVEPSRWDDFEEFIKEAGLHLEWTPQDKKTMPVTMEEICVENVIALDSLRPFGTGFEQPVFRIDQPEIISSYDFSDNRHRRYTLANRAEMLLFNLGSEDLVHKNSPVESAQGSLTVSSFRGQTKAEMILCKIEYKD